LQAQDLRVGDMVWTADHGLQPVKWLGKTKLSANYLAHDPKQQPITLTKNSLAPRDCLSMGKRQSSLSRESLKTID
jgi:hypothetical protein